MLLLKRRKPLRLQPLQLLQLRLTLRLEPQPLLMPRLLLKAERRKQRMPPLLRKPKLLRLKLLNKQLKVKPARLKRLVLQLRSKLVRWRLLKRIWNPRWRKHVLIWSASNPTLVLAMARFTGCKRPLLKLKNSCILVERDKHLTHARVGFVWSGTTSNTGTW